VHCLLRLLSELRMNLRRLAMGNRISDYGIHIQAWKVTGIGVQMNGGVVRAHLN